VVVPFLPSLIFPQQYQSYLTKLYCASLCGNHNLHFSRGRRFLQWCKHPKIIIHDRICCMPWKAFYAVITCRWKIIILRFDYSFCESITSTGVGDPRL
jgi:hypothetical protein